MGSFNKTGANKLLCKAKSKDEEFVTQKTVLLTVTTEVSWTGGQ